MKFKNPAHQHIFNDAISAFHAQKWNEAIQGLQTLALFLQESREKSQTQEINTLIESIQNPHQREALAAKLKAQSQAALNALQEKRQKKESFKTKIDAQEEAAHKTFAQGDYYNAAIDYAAIAAKTKGLPDFKANHADAMWSQASSYESLAFQIAASTPVKAQLYVEKAIKCVRESLVVYTQLNATFDIDECTKKIKALKQYKDTLQAQINQEETTQADLFANFIKVTQSFEVQDLTRESTANLLIALGDQAVYLSGFNTQSAAKELRKSLSDLTNTKDNKNKLVQ